MDIHQLQLVLAVMESPSMTRAAEKMCLSPGAVSLQLHNLADELHTQLFVRNGKKLSPTPAALRLAEHARNLVRLTSQIKQEFETDVSTDTRPFHFSTGVTTLIYQLGKPLRQLRQQYPKAEIRVTVNPTEETIEGLHNRRFYDAIYIPRDSNVQITTKSTVDLAEFSAEVAGKYPVQVVRYSDVEKDPGLNFTTGEPGARRHLNMLLAKNVQAGRLVAGFTDSEPGNWTSWPPHEHARCWKKSMSSSTCPSLRLGFKWCITTPITRNSSL